MSFTKTKTMKTKGKSIIVQIVTAMLIAIVSMGHLFNDTTTAILGAVGAALVLVMKTFFPTGTLVPGWDLLLWVTNVGAVILQLVNIFSSVIFIPAEVLGYLTAIVNTVILIIANQEYGIMRR